MHRYVAFVLLLSLFLFPCTSFAADLNGVQFTQGEPHRSLDFRQYFELMTTTQEPCTYPFNQKFLILIKHIHFFVL